MNKIIIGELDDILRKYNMPVGISNRDITVTLYGEQEFIFNEFMLVTKDNGNRESYAVSLIGDNGMHVKKKDATLNTTYEYIVNNISDINDIDIDSSYSKIQLTDTGRNNLMMFYMPRANVFRLLDYRTNMFAAKTFKEFVVHMICLDLNNILVIMNIIMNVAKERALKEHDKRTFNTVHKSNELKDVSNELKEVRTDSKVFLLDEIIEYASSHVPQHTNYKYTCECWDVRGHYRRLKDGRIVFVKPYKKGKNRKNGESASKEYII